MKKIKSILFTSFIACLPVLSYAQANGEEMADVMRSNGKIFVVIGVIAIILVGLLIYLMAIDKKVRILEKNSKKM